MIAAMASSAFAENWSRFRGPNGSGISESTSVPMSWLPGESLRWAVDMPGPGGSSPIVFGDRVFVTCFTGFGANPESPGTPADLVRHLLCYNRKDGQLVWKSSVASTHEEDPFTGFITQHGYASSTPVTDGIHVYVAFGKTGVLAFDFDGKEIWRRELGTKSDPAQWGDGASPVLHGDLLIMNAGITDHAVVALNKLTGEVVWRVEDQDFTNGWSTPIIVNVQGREELVCACPGRIFALEPKSGEELWRAKSPISDAVCASLTHQDGVVFLMGGRQGSAVAIRCGGSGDVSATHTVWEKPLRSGIGTPVISDGRLYWTSTGLAICADCKTGDEVFKERLKKPNDEPGQGGGRGPTGDYASAVAVAGKILVVSRTGHSQFWDAVDKYSPIADNQFADDTGPFNGTPAVVDDEIFIRSDKRLYCLGG